MNNPQSAICNPQSAIKSPGQPFITMLGHKPIIVQLGIGAVDPVDFLALAGTERLAWVETADVFKEPLAAEHLVEARDAAGVTARGIEKRGVGVGDFNAAAEQFGGNCLARLSEPATLGVEFD